MIDPTRDYIVTANKPVTSEAYPYLLTDDWAYGYRSQRIVELVEDAGPLDADAMVEIQMDSRNANAEVLVPVLLDIDGLGDYYSDGLDLLARVGLHPTARIGGRGLLQRGAGGTCCALTFHDDLPEDRRPGGGDRWFEVVRRTRWRARRRLVGRRHDRGRRRDP